MVAPVRLPDLDAVPCLVRLPDHLVQAHAPVLMLRRLAAAAAR